MKTLRILNYFPLALVLILCLASCNKDDDDNGGNGNGGNNGGSFARNTLSVMIDDGENWTGTIFSVQADSFSHNLYAMNEVDSSEFTLLLPGSADATGTFYMDSNDVNALYHSADFGVYGDAFDGMAQISSNSTETKIEGTFEGHVVSFSFIPDTLVLTQGKFNFTF